MVSFNTFSIIFFLFVYKMLSKKTLTSFVADFVCACVQSNHYYIL